MQYGHFEDRHREYVITQPDTPLPWINYLGNRDYFGIISNTGGGYSFYKDARLRRITRYRYNNVPLDSNGRYIYIRDDSHRSAYAGTKFWSPTWQPTRVPLDFYECRHGLGYTKIRSMLDGIESSIRYFVPLDENLEIWEMTIINKRPEISELSLYSAVEFNLWDAMDDGTNFQRNFSIGEVEVSDGVIYHKSEYRERRNHFAYLACSEPLTGFETQRSAFLGDYGGWDSPKAFDSDKLSNSIAHGWQPIGVQQVKIELKPGEEKKLIFMLGYFENPSELKFSPADSQIINKTGVKQVIEKYLKPDNVEDAFLNLHDYWEELLGKIQVRTPDVHTNRMINIWNIYQIMTTFNLSRSASYFESGIGRGMGFRDSNQDLLGFVQLIPERARSRILDLAAVQLPNGGAYHQYQPLTKKGNNETGSEFNDDPLWLVLAVAAYIKESGDWSILEERIPYNQQPGTEEPLFEHLKKSIQYTMERQGPHGLPLIGRADWNDCLNLNCFSETPGQSFQTAINQDGKIAESIFIAGLFILAAKEIISIANEIGENEYAQSVSNLINQMEQSIWSAGWDGQWFRRAYDHYGEKIGSKTCNEGKIFIEPQGICVMAGLGLENGKACQALDSVSEYLDTPHGIVLLQPAYSRYYPNLGEISSYPPGYKENAGIFCHANPWIMIAEKIVGRGNRAFDYYRKINPSAREAISDIHKCEPYVYAQMIAGKDAFSHGEAKNSWLTGTAAWNYVAMVQWILGIRPNFHGLEIAPVIPDDWQEFYLTRVFRETLYEIYVERVGPGNIVQIMVDDNPIQGNIVPLPHNKNQTIRVNVRVGNMETHI